MVPVNSFYDVFSIVLKSDHAQKYAANNPEDNSLISDNFSVST